MKEHLKKLTYTQFVAFGFLLIILIGGILLTFPAASKSGVGTPFVDALFTATSATCVTGLAVYDTYQHWSLFGQLVILILIQIGGIGFMTVITMFSILMKRQISLRERKLIVQSAGALKVGGAVSLIKRVALATFLLEGIGTILLAFRFIPEMGIRSGIYNAIFHSISAFCNAGFDLMGRYDAFSSLTRYVSDSLVNLTICALIIVGGLGFIVWNDITAHRLHFSRYQLHSKIVLTMTGVLLFFGTLLFLIFEYHDTQTGMNAGQRILASLFEAVTPRTAGFNTTSLEDLSESGSLLTMILMFIGGNPGSTAGGIKTSTLFVLVLSIGATCTHSPNITIFKRSLEDGIARQAAAIATIYLIAITSGAMVIAAIESFSLRDIMMETISAAGTVGLSTGISAAGCVTTKIIFMILMFGGRVGGLTLALVLAEKRVFVPIERPVEKILIG